MATNEQKYIIERCEDLAGKLVDELQLLEDVSSGTERGEVEMVKDWIYSARHYLKHIAER